MVISHPFECAISCKTAAFSLEIGFVSIRFHTDFAPVYPPSLPPGANYHSTICNPNSFVAPGALRVKSLLLCKSFSFLCFFFSQFSPSCFLSLVSFESFVVNLIFLLLSSLISFVFLFLSCPLVPFVLNLFFVLILFHFYAFSFPNFLLRVSFPWCPLSPSC
jgi:hypothetical protein